MKYRLGECSSCGANFKVPASFEADRAKCKSCGGVVEIGPVREDAPQPAKPAAATPPPMPARKVAPAKAESPEPAPKKERTGPSMKERLLAQRRAEAEAAAKQQTTSKPAAKPAAKSGAAKPSPARRGAPAGARARRGADEADEAPARGSSRGGSRRGGSSRRSAPAKSRRGGRGRGGDEDDDAEDGGRGGRRGRRPQKKQNPMLLVVAGVMILLAAGAGFFLMNQGGDSADEVIASGNGETGADASSDAANDAAADPASADGDATTDDAASDDAATDDPGTTEESSGTDDAASTDAAAEAPSGAANETNASEPAAEKPARTFKDPASVDLAAIEDFGVPQGCTEERWAELQELAAQMMDPFAGAAGRRAGKKLVEEGKFAIPAILNVMKTFDLTDNDQFLTANAAQKTLTEICNGINLGWQYPDSQPDTWHYYDKRAIQSWCDLWKRYDSDHGYWLTHTKRDKGSKPEETPSDDVGGEDDLDALDDL